MKRVVKVNIGQILNFKEELEKSKKLEFNSKEYKDLAKKITDNIMEEIKGLIPK